MIEVTEDDFNPGEHIEAARTRQTGGIVTFTGIVRDDDITSMDLEAYREVALEELTLIRDRAMALFQVNSIDIVHRIGRLQVGDHIVMIVVGSPHRKSAFQACEYIIDKIKESVPIWKKEHTKGGSRWVPGDHHPGTA